MQTLDAVVGHRQDLERPQPFEGPGVYLCQHVPTQVQKPGAMGDTERDLDQPTRPAVHQVRGLVAQAGAGAQLETEHRVQKERQ